MKYKTSKGELHFTEHKKYKKGKNKMEGMVSLSTSSICNSFCERMSKNKSLICSSCYARKLESFRKTSIGDVFYRNGLILKNRLNSSDIPLLKPRTYRFNSFGELLGVNHYKNLLAIAEANPDSIFALWTKRADIIRRNKLVLPNMIHVYSSPKLNKVKDAGPEFDKIFTVFNTSFVRDNNITINCKQQCKNCMLCYTHNDVRFVNEALRSA